MKFINRFLILLPLLILAALPVNAAPAAANPLDVALALSKDYKVPFMPIMEGAEQTQIALAYAHTGQMQQAKKIIDKIETTWQRLSALGQYAVLLEAGGDKNGAKALLNNIISTIEAHEWEEERKKNLAYLSVVESFVDLQEYGEVIKYLHRINDSELFMIGVTHSAGEAIKAGNNKVAHDILYFGLERSIEMLGDRPNMLHSIHFIAYKYHQIGDDTSARNLLEMITNHDMKRTLEEGERVGFLFIPYYAKLLLLEQYDLAAQALEHKRRLFLNDPKGQRSLDEKLLIIDAELAVISALKDKDGIGKSVETIKNLSDPNVRLYAYSHAADRLSIKKRMEESFAMLKLASDEILDHINEDSVFSIYDANTLIYTLIESKRYPDAKKLLDVMESKSSGFDDIDDKVSAWVDMAKYYYRMGEDKLLDRYLVRIDDEISMLPEGNRLDDAIKKIVEMYVEIKKIESAISLIPKMSDSYHRTHAVDSIVDGYRKQGDFNAALKYSAQIKDRGTVLQNLRFISTDMYDQNVNLDSVGIQYLKEIATNEYSEM